MSAWEKLEAKILSMDTSIRFEEIKKILENYGYTMNNPRGGSSHCVFRKPGCYPITIPKHKPIKKVYIRMVRKVIEQEGQ